MDTMTRVIAGSLVLAISLGCFKAFDAPECSSISDCPPGYTVCEDGYCFKKSVSGCEGAAPVPGDSCCPPTEGDRGRDTDCLVTDLDLGPVGAQSQPEDRYVVKALSAPAILDDGSAIVSAVVEDGTGASVIMAFKTDSTLRQVVARARVGEGQVAMPVVVGGDFSVYVAYGQGVARLSVAALEMEDNLHFGAVVGGVVAVAGDNPTVVFLTDSRMVEFYVEKKRTRIETKLSPENGAGEAFAPVLSASGRRAYWVFKSGQVVAVRTVDNPVGPSAFGCADGDPVTSDVPRCSGDAPSGPAVEWGGVVYVPLVSGKVVALVEKEPQLLTRKWILDLGGPISGRLLVDTRGRVVAVLQDGRVWVVKDLEEVGSLVERGSFGEAMAQTPGVLGAAERVVAVSAGGRRILSLLRKEGATDGDFVQGLRFDVPVAPATALALGDGVIVFGDAAGRLMAWTFPDRLPGSGFPKDGGDRFNRGGGLLP